MDTFNLIGIGVVILFAGMLFMSAVGLGLVVLFWKTRKIVVPKITLLIVTGLEVPIKKLGSIVRVDGAFIDRMAMHMRNILNKNTYSKVPYHMRAVFMPQCLRHPQCPARLSTEGIQCVNCGRCGLGELKKEAESQGIGFYIAPGSSLIKRIITNYKPRAILGVGCHMEVKEGGALMAAISMPAQAVCLQRDGCVDTRVDVRKVLESMFLTNNPKLAHFVSDERIMEIESKWSPAGLVTEMEKDAAQQKYFDREKQIISLLKLD